MTKLKFLIASQQKSILEYYELLFSKYFQKIQKLLIVRNNFIEDINFNKYNVILIDFDEKKYLSSLTKILKKDLNNSKIILITPFDMKAYINILEDVLIFDLILTKPIDSMKLEDFIKNISEEIKKTNLLKKKNKVLGKVVDLHPAKIAVYNMNGNLFYANNNYLDANNLNIEDIDNLHFNDISHCNIGFSYVKEKLENTSTFVFQKEQENQWFESTFYIISKEFIIHSCIDITATKQKELQLEQSAIFFDNSNEGIVITDANSNIISVNKAFSRITGYSKEEVLGKNPSILNSGIHDKKFFDEMKESLKKNSKWKGEIWNKRKNSEIYPEWLSISKAVNPKYNEEFYIAIFTDISSLKETDRKLYFYANHDILTKLANRVQFETHLKNSIENCRKNGTKLALFFIDLDKFKDVNDTCGHSIGDKMLQTIAMRLEQSIRKEDFIARLGGDEFVLIIKDVKNSEDMLNLAHKLNKNIKEVIVIEDKIFFMTLSIGISIFPDDGENSELLVKNADAAMYEVKENGRNGYGLYNQNITDKIFKKLSIENELKIAINKDEFEMYYQAVVDMKTEKIVGAEALVRWNHKKRGVLSPIHFIAYIDASSMAIDFGKLVFIKVLKDIQKINSKIKEDSFKVAINISPEYFFKYTFVEDIVLYCNKYKIDSKQIELELLETNIMKNSEVSQRKIAKLHKKGFKIALDDFGTGYSSLSYLKNFQVDKLKIDQAFIRDFLEDNNDKSIVEAIINLANIFQLKAQAEGVETKEHHELLQSLNCSLAQGYFYNKPMPLDEFIKFIHSKNT